MTHGMLAFPFQDRERDGCSCPCHVCHPAKTSEYHACFCTHHMVEGHHRKDVWARLVMVTTWRRATAQATSLSSCGPRTILMERRSALATAPCSESTMVVEV